MTKSEAVAGHRKLWGKITDLLRSGEKYDYADDYKKIALREIGECDGLFNDCYCCEYSNDNHCIDCPVIWENDDTCCHAEYGIFCRAVLNKDYFLATEYAEKIANLPERWGV